MLSVPAMLSASSMLSPSLMLSGLPILQAVNKAQHRTARMPHRALRRSRIPIVFFFVFLITNAPPYSCVFYGSFLSQFRAANSTGNETIRIVMYPRTTSSAGASRDWTASQGQHIPSFPCHGDHFYDAFLLTKVSLFGNASFSSLLRAARMKWRFRLPLPGRFRFPVSSFSPSGTTL